ncbi:MAG TPA: hypothetical protein DCO83_10010 [Mucilaginibacter sp.]|jgi:hypothetical protein|nr:hypothetical protein [Mucilaginibacter sp.]
MIAQTKSTDLDEFGEKILYGVNKALRKLVETSAANDGSLVISDGKGNVKSVPAKELLKKLPKQKQ